MLTALALEVVLNSLVHKSALVLGGVQRMCTNVCRLVVRGSSFTTTYRTSRILQRYQKPQLLSLNKL